MTQGETAMSRFVDFLLRAYAPLAARHALVENVCPSARASDPTHAPKNSPAIFVPAIRPSAAPPLAQRQPTSLAA